MASPADPYRCETSADGWLALWKYRYPFWSHRKWSGQLKRGDRSPTFQEQVRPVISMLSVDPSARLSPHLPRFRLLYFHVWVIVAIRAPDYLISNCGDSHLGDTRTLPLYVVLVQAYCTIRNGFHVSKIFRGYVVMELVAHVLPNIMAAVERRFILFWPYTYLLEKEQSLYLPISWRSAILLNTPNVCFGMKYNENRDSHPFCSSGGNSFSSFHWG